MNSKQIFGKNFEKSLMIKKTMGWKCNLPMNIYPNIGGSVCISSKHLVIKMIPTSSESDEQNRPLLLSQCINKGNGKIQFYFLCISRFSVIYKLLFIFNVIFPHLCLDILLNAVIVCFLSINIIIQSTDDVECSFIYYSVLIKWCI